MAYLVRGLGLNCPGDAGCPGNVQPDTAAPPDVQQQIADIWSYLWDGAGAGGTVLVQAAPAASFDFATWVNAHSGALLAGAGGLFLFSLLRGRR